MPGGIIISPPAATLVAEPVMAGTGGLIPVASYSGVTGSGTASYGADALRSWRGTAVTILVDTPILVLEYINWYPNGGTDADGPAAMTLRVGVEKTASIILPVKFTGADTVTIPAGGAARSDPIYGDFRAGDVIYIRTTCTMATGSTYVYTGVAGAGYAFGPVEDTSRVGDHYAGGANQAVCPVRFLGRPTAGAVKRAVALIGDSIMQGANHDADAYLSPFGLALRNQNVPFIKIAKGGETMQSFATLPGSNRRLALVVGCTDAVLNYGTNDLAGARTLAQFQADCIISWQRLARMGMRVRHTTLTPRTTGSSWVDGTGQTPVTGFEVGGKRQLFNEWLRDGAPILAGAAVASGSSAVGTLRAGATGHPLTGYIEVADVVETTRNSGLWKPNYTNDGIHPYADTPRTAIAAAVPSYAA